MWTATADLKPEPNKPIIWMMLDSITEQEGLFHHNLWWSPDNKVYVYYTPVRWRYK